MSHPLQLVEGSVVNSCLSTTGWSAITGNLSLDAPPNDRYGSAPCVKCTSGVNANGIIDLTLNQTLTGRMGFLIYLDEQDVAAGNTNNTTDCLLYVANDAGYTNFFTRTVTLRIGWNYIQIGRATPGGSSVKETDWQSSGSPSWASPMTRIRIRANAKANTANRFWVRTIRDGDYHKPIVIFDFDDAYSDVYTEAFPLLTALGMRGTINVISSQVGQSGFMTEAQLNEVYEAGWDLCNHTKTHEPNKHSESYAYWDGEISDCEEYLRSRGWTRRNCHTHFASPYGAYTHRQAGAYRQAVSDLCESARTIVERPMSAWVDDPMFTGCIMQYGPTETTAQVLERLNACISHGGVFRFLCHFIRTPADQDTIITPTHFQTFAKHVYRLREAGMLDVMTYTEWYEMVKDIRVVS